MKTMPVYLALSIIAALQTAGAAEMSAAARCAAPAHHQFDFWIGNWSVTENGKPAGSNRIDRLLGGCALMENWVGVDGSRGHSLNFYDPRHGVWQQTWIDNSGGALNLTGQFNNGHMVLTGASTDVKTHAQRIDRISWTQNSDGTVRQLWNQSQDGGKSWQVVFDGRYTRQAP